VSGGDDFGGRDGVYAREVSVRSRCAMRRQRGLWSGACFLRASQQGVGGAVEDQGFRPFPIGRDVFDGMVDSMASLPLVSLSVMASTRSHSLPMPPAGLNDSAHRRGRRGFGCGCEVVARPRFGKKLGGDFGTHLAVQRTEKSTVAGQVFRSMVIFDLSPSWQLTQSAAGGASGEIGRCKAPGEPV